MMLWQFFWQWCTCLLLTTIMIPKSFIAIVYPLTTPIYFPCWRWQPLRLWWCCLLINWIWCILWLRLWQSLWYEWSNCTPTFLKYFQALVQHHDDVTKKETQALSQQQPHLKQEHYEVPQYDNNLQFIIVCSYALQQWQESRLCQELFYVYTTIGNYLKENKIHDHDVWIFIS